jgi:anti-sigma regulatory factor (Ser/Thr protein kinase)
MTAPPPSPDAVPHWGERSPAAPPPESGTWTFPPDRASVGQARARARALLWDLPGTEASQDSVLLVVSELMSNAVQHATGPAAVRLCLQVVPDTGRVHIELEDGDPRPPTPADRPGTEGGRGLLIVDRLSSRWGWDRVEGSGKRVWSDIDPGAASGTGQASGRPPGRTEVTGAPDSPGHTRSVR